MATLKKMEARGTPPRARWESNKNPPAIVKTWITVEKKKSADDGDAKASDKKAAGKKGADAGKKADKKAGKGRR